MNVNYPCGCEGEITLYFSDFHNGTRLTDRGDGLNLYTKLSKVCQDHQNNAREEFIENTKKYNEKRLSMAQSSPIGASL